MKDELQIETHYLKAKSLIQRIKDISYSVSQLEQKFPARVLDAERKEWMLRTYIAFKFDLEDILKDLNKLHKEYKDGEK